MSMKGDKAKQKTAQKNPETKSTVREVSQKEKGGPDRPVDKRELWAQICDEELLGVVPELTLGNIPPAEAWTEPKLQEKETYLSNVAKDILADPSERNKVNLKLLSTDDADISRVLEVKGPVMSSHIMKAIGTLITCLDTIRVLKLVHCNLKSESIFMIAYVLGGNSKIGYLYLDENPVVDQNYHILLRDNLTLQHLSLRMCRIDKKGAILLAKELTYSNPEHQRLKSLNLNANLIDCEGMIAIAQALRWNRSLLYLSVAGNRIADKGAIALADIFLPFQLTYEELGYRAERLAERLIKLDSIMREERYVATPKRHQRRRSNQEVSESTSKKNTAVDNTALYLNLCKTADESLPQDQHPLITEVEESEDEYWSRGNDYITGLNISTNRITIDGLSQFLEVARYQHSYLPLGKGLKKLLYEGNPVEDNYAILEGLRKHFSVSRKQSLQAKKASLAKGKNK